MSSHKTLLDCLLCTLSRLAIYFLYAGSSLTKLFAAIVLNTFIAAYCCHDKTGTYCVEFCTLDNIVIGISRQGLSLCLRNVIFVEPCPANYHIMQLSERSRLVVQWKSVQNVRILLRLFSFGIEIDSVTANYYLVDEEDWGTLSFLQKKASDHQSKTSEHCADIDCSKNSDCFISSSFVSTEFNAKTEQVYGNATPMHSSILDVCGTFLKGLCVTCRHVNLRQKFAGKESPTDCYRSDRQKSLPQRRKLLNATGHFLHLRFDATNKAVFEMANVAIELTSEAETATNFAELQFSEPLLLSFDTDHNAAAVHFEDRDSGRIVGRLASCFVVATNEWIEQVIQRQGGFSAPVVDEEQHCKVKESHVTTHFTLNVCVTVQLIIETVAKNQIHCCVKCLEADYSTMADCRRVDVKVEHVSLALRSVFEETTETNIGEQGTESLLLTAGDVEVEICRRNGKLKRIEAVLSDGAAIQHCRQIGAVRCTNDDSWCVRCSNIDQDNYDPMLIFQIAKNTSLVWTVGKPHRLSLHFEAFSAQKQLQNSHISGSFGAVTAHRFVLFLSAIVRDLLDTLLPNRLFVPGLAEARSKLHARTDLPDAAALARPQYDTNDKYVLQPSLLLVVSLARNTSCIVELCLHDCQFASECTLYFETKRFDWSLFNLPNSVEQFCTNLLHSSCAVDCSNLALRDGVVGSHWSQIIRFNKPLQIRLVQKVRYLPTMQTLKKLRVRNGGPTFLDRRSDTYQSQVVANVHEATLRFLVDYYKQLTNHNTAACQTPDKTKTMSLTSTETWRGEALVRWTLQVCPFALCVSYKPVLRGSSLLRTTFLDLPNVPNIPLSNAHIRLCALEPTKDLYFDCFDKAVRHYFDKCFPQIQSLLLSASSALPVVQPVVETARDFAKDVRSPSRSWSQTAARVAGNVVYGSTKLSVATYKVAQSTDRWLEKRQKKLSEPCPQQKTEHKKSYHAHSCPDHFCASPLNMHDAYDGEIGDTSSGVINEEHSVREDYLPTVEPRLSSRKSKPIPIVNNSAQQPTRRASRSVSMYANQPTSFNSGLRETADLLQENAQEMFSAAVLEPKRVFRRTGGSWSHGATAALYGLPRIVARTASGVSAAGIKMGHGLSNSIDKEKGEERKKKWKHISHRK